MKFLKNKKIRNTMLVLLAIVFLFSSIKLILYFIDLSRSKKEREELIEEVLNIDSIVTEDGEEQEQFTVDFEKLKSINSDTMGWIRYNSDQVNNPIVKTSNNSYYLDHSFQKKTNQVGTIFMDYRNHSFDDQNVVLFGHATGDKSMFGSLEQLFDPAFFETEGNQYIYINDTNNTPMVYHIFSYYVIEKEEYYITPSFSTDEAFSAFLKTMKSRSYRDFGQELTTSDHILTLSTCAGAGDTPKRIVVHAKRIS